MNIALSLETLRWLTWQDCLYCQYFTAEHYENT